MVLRLVLLSNVQPNSKRLLRVIDAPSPRWFSRTSNAVASASSRRRWSKEEVQTLQRLANSDLKADGILSHLPGRSLNAVYMKSWALGIRLSQGQFSIQENEKLRKAKAAGLSWAQIKDELPGRSSKAIESRWYNYAAANPIRSSKSWSDTERKHLMKLRDSATLNWPEIAIRLGRDAKLCRNAYYRFTSVDSRKRFRESHTAWSKMEVEELITSKNNKLSNAEIAKKLQRSINGVKQQWYAVRQNGEAVRPFPWRWSAEEDMLLWQSIQTKTSPKLPGRTQHAVDLRKRLLQRKTNSRGNGS